jgi:hypothetical protein
MSQKSGGRELMADPPAHAFDKDRWVSRRRAARELGIDERTIPKVATAAQIRTKKIPGILGHRYFLPDVQRVARESVRETRQTGTARTR